MLSGEHGIGLMKRDFMLEAVDPETLGALHRVKEALDPWASSTQGRSFPKPCSFFTAF